MRPDLVSFRIDVRSVADGLVPNQSWYGGMAGVWSDMPFHARRKPACERGARQAQQNIIVPIAFSRGSVQVFAMGWSAATLFSLRCPMPAVRSSFLRRQGT